MAKAAIASFLSPDADEQREAAMSRRLDHIDRQAARMERDLGIGLETLALFIRYWMTVSPPLPESAAAGARAQGTERWNLPNGAARPLSPPENPGSGSRIPLAS